MKFDYSKNDIIKSLKNVGVLPGDNIFIHSNIGFCGRLEDANSPQEFYNIYKEAIFEVITKKGTLVVPTFSYSFCHKKIFDKDNTESTCGFLSEMLRKDPESERSEDANFSISAIGENAKYFTQDAPEYSFGKGSFWEKFIEKDGKFCNINFDLGAGSTLFHYVERELNVAYRFDKPFEGIFKSGNKEEKRVYYHFCYDLEKPNNGPDGTKFDYLAKKIQIAKTANLGKGQIVFISARDTFDLIKKEIEVDPAFLIVGNSIE